MINKTKISVFKDFTRGGQITMHSLRMFAQAMRYILLLAISIWLALFIIFVMMKTNSYDRYIISEYVQAQIKIAMQDHDVTHDIKTPHGHLIKLKAIDFVRHPKSLKSLERLLQGVDFALLYSITISMFFVLGGAIWFFLKGKSQRATTELRGGTRVDASDLAKSIKAANKASDLKIAKVPLIKDSEVQHILVTGTTGTGKSVCLQELMDQVRAKGQRAIVYDIEGTFIPLYYRPGKDIILNPLDERSPGWNIWQECRDAADYEAIASSLMPLHLSGSDPFWIHSARTIFAAAAFRLQRDGKCYNKELLGPLFTENLGELSALLEGSVAESLVSDKNEKTALSIKATLSTYCKALTYLKDDTTGLLFSIRKWIESDRGDGWLFIASNALKIDALKPLLSVWLDVAAKSILSLPQSFDRRIWFFLDELATLHRLPSLINTLSRGRKYGGCFVGAIQDIHQLRTLYGRDEAEVLTTLFNTHLCFRTSGPDSSAWMSKMMGSREIVEHKEGLSYGANDIRDSISIHQDRRREPIILDSEFLELENLQAFLKLPGAWPIAKIAFGIKKRKYHQPALIERAIKDNTFLESTFTQESIELTSKKITDEDDKNKVSITEESLSSRAFSKTIDEF